MNCIRRQVHNPRMAAIALTMLALLFTFAGSSVPAQAQIPTPTLLYYFQGPPTDVCQALVDTHLWGPLVQGRDGNLYGADDSCGTARNTGGVFKITPAGAESVLVNFPANFNGCIGGLTLASDGNFYGSCVSGNPATGLGSLYRVTPAGVFTDLYDFTGANSDAAPYFAPIQATDGNLYGTTSGNGGAGNVYRLTLAGVYTNLHTFSGGDSLPFGTLVQATDGNLYGTLQDCALTGNRGCAYKISTKGVYKEFYGFVDATGSSPYSGLIQGTNGKLYGSTDGGGTNNGGVIYSLTTAGKITVLHNIDSATDGYQPSIIQATDGNFYGGAWGGALGNQGGLYELTSKNVFSAFLLSQSENQPVNPLIQHTNGLLYGTTSTSFGTGNDFGTVFSLDIGAKPFVNLASLSGKQGATVAVFGQGFTSGSVVKFGGVPSEAVTLTGSTYLTATVPAGALTGTVTVTEGSATLTSRQTYKVLPTFLSFTPPSGPVGTSVTITGTGLTQATLVKFDGKSATFTVVSDTEITATVPATALTGAISVTTKGGAGTSKTKFTVN